MQTISLKMEDNLLKEIDDNLARHLYTTRTEFIRDAIRNKLTELEKMEMIKAVKKLRGISKRKTTDGEMHAAREKVIKILEKKHGIS